MTEIIKELNENNSTNYKLDVLKNHKDNELLKRVLKMAYDKVTFTYGITMKNVVEVNDIITYNLSEALDILETKFCTRKWTGNKALEYLGLLLGQVSKDDSEIIKKILDRDLKINVGKTQINKVWKDLIIKPPYMRCGTYSEKTSKKISFPALVQLKADGMFQAIQVENGKVTFTARSGEERSLPHLEEQFKMLPDGVYIGELLVQGLNNRSEANGFINSDEEDKSSVYVQLWDFVSLEEYSRSKDKKNKTLYSERFKTLRNNVDGSHDIVIIPYFTVDNIQEALKITSDWMNKGFEGSILKDLNNIFIDHTSPTQLKLKLEISVEMRITGFQEGTPGTKREATFGAMIFENDEGTIKGRCSGFTDKQLEDFNSRREELIGKIIEVQFNDLSKARDSDYYALSHPRFIEIREKDETDTLEKAFELRQMAMELS
jgi:hypothetical protein